jgi:hypothetical protein
MERERRERRKKKGTEAKHITYLNSAAKAK